MVSYIDSELQDKDLEDVMGALKPKKRVQKGCIKGKLTNHRCYLAGPIDNANDDGVGWRQLATPYLLERGIQILDPTDKPVSQCRFNEIGDEKDMIKKMIKLERWDELRDIAKEIVLIDLRMVEVADFLIAYIDPDMHICGTYDEIFEALRHRKPTLVVHKGGKSRMSMWLRGKLNHNFVFESFEDVFNYIDALHDGTVEPDYTRWVFFDKV
jgi:nucleoside 2-deoxyribosyltransferase